MEQKTKRGFAIALSVLIHGLILFLVARFTIDLTSPEGTVDDGTLTMEVMSEGSQTVSMDVAQNAEVAPTAPPAVVASPQATTPGTPPPVAAIAESSPETSPSEPETTSQDSLIAMAAQENPPPTAAEPSPTTTLQEDTSAIGAAPMIEEPSQSAPVTEPAPAPAEAVAAIGPTEGTVSENYGVPSGAKDAKTLAASPGNRRPEYPLMARFRRIQGRTVAQFSVSGDGTVSNARIFSSDSEAFNASVLSAVQTWKFKGPIAPGEYYWAFDFKLSGQEKEVPGRLRTK